LGKGQSCRHRKEGHLGCRLRVGAVPEDLGAGAGEVHTPAVTASPSPEPIAPAGQTTAATPGITGPATVTPRRPDLTQLPEDHLVDPRPATLATQEIRLAPAFTGGVSLAVWMGGVTRELDLLVQASARRRRPDLDPVDPSTPDTDPVRRAYRRLLDLV